MKCLNCDSTTFENRKVSIDTSYSGESFEVIVPADVCKKCGEPLMDSEQMNFLRQAAADKYRSNHGLLTSHEIQALRKNLEMSQREFATYLGVGEASIKRWETYYAQEQAMDEHIRLKCDRDFAERNAIDVQVATQPKDLLSGDRDFSWEKFSNLTLTLVKNCRSPLFINKSLFYADFLHHKKNKTSITGCTYAKLDYGPCPNDYRLLFKKMVDEGMIEETKKHTLAALVTPNRSIFDDDENETIDRILELTKKDSGQDLYDMSHKEDAYTKSDMYCLISYNHSKKLKIK